MFCDALITGALGCVAYWEWSVPLLPAAQNDAVTVPEHAIYIGRFDLNLSIGWKGFPGRAAPRGSLLSRRFPSDTRDDVLRHGARLSRQAVAQHFS